MKYKYSFYDSLIYIFGGDFKIIKDGVYTEGPFNMAKVFKDNKWSDIGDGKLPNVRYFGS